MSSPRIAGSNSEGPGARYRTRDEESAEKVPEGAFLVTLGRKLLRGNLENQDLYSTQAQKSSVIRPDFFGMVPGVGNGSAFNTEDTEDTEDSGTHCIVALSTALTRKCVLVVFSISFRIRDLKAVF